VLGVDLGEQIRAIEQARFAAATTGLDVEFQAMSVYDVGQLDRRFDVVLFLGVFYHLRHPLLALDSIRKVCRGTLLMQTITTPHAISGSESCPPPTNADSGLRSPNLNQPSFPLLRFIEGGFDGDKSCWFVPSVEAVVALLRSSGFKPENMILPTEHEIILRASKFPNSVQPS
jgi:tRNA (mo5U34)-methyltransferase